MRLVPKILIVLCLLASAGTAQAEWVRQNSNTLAWLRSVHFLDDNRGFVGGSRGTFLTTVDGGKKWQPAVKFTDDTILDIFFKDSSTGWLLCERDIFNLGTRSPSYLMKTTDGGKNWERIGFKNDHRRRITRIFFAKNGFGLAIGETGTLYGLEDDGRTWQQLAPPSSYLMLDGMFTDDLHGAIVGGGGTILFTEDAGATWDTAFIADKSRAKLNSVFFPDQRNGWAAGSSGRIYRTANGGKYWRLQKTGTTRDLNDVFFINGAQGWAVGDAGTILQTKDAGDVWEDVSVTSPHKLEQIYFNGRRGWIVGFGGTILSYETRSETDARRPKFAERGS